jgi:hypothetical protein
MYNYRKEVQIGVKDMVDISKYYKAGEIESEVNALYAVIVPILRGITYSLKREMLDDFGLTYDTITLSQLARVYREGSGDAGICFEYAVHDAILNENPAVLDRIDTALVKFCKIKNGDPTSILFGAEKNGAMQLIDSVQEYLTDESALLPGTKGKPIKLKKHIQGVINAFRKPSEREKLPSSINGLWKADLFVGKAEPDKWIGTTVKINPSQLEGAKGLRLAIVPAKHEKSDKIYIHETKNLIVCPLPYDQSFVEIFYQGWNIIKMFLNADAHLPREVLLPRGADRLVCKEMEIRRNYPVVDVMDAFSILQQPDLVLVDDGEVSLHSTLKDTQINKIIAPMAIH